MAVKAKKVAEEAGVATVNAQGRSPADLHPDSLQGMKDFLGGTMEESGKGRRGGDREKAVERGKGSRKKGGLPAPKGLGRGRKGRPETERLVMEEQKEALEEELQEKAKQLVSAEAKLSAFQAEVEELRAKLTAKYRTDLALQEELKTERLARERQEKLAKEADARAEVVIAEAEERERQLQERILELEAENAQLRRERDALQRRVEELQKQVWMLKASYSEANDKVEDLQNEKALNTRELRRQQLDLEEANFEMTQLQGSLQQTEQKLESAEEKLGSVRGSLSAAASAAAQKSKRFLGAVASRSPKLLTQ